MKQAERPLGEVIREILKRYRLEDHLEETRMVGLWPGVCGKMIASHTTAVSVKGGVMHVKLDSAALRQELQYRKAKLVKMMNAAAGREVISEIIFS